MVEPCDFNPELFNLLELSLVLPVRIKILHPLDVVCPHVHCLEYSRYVFDVSLPPDVSVICLGLAQVVDFLVEDVV